PERPVRSLECLVHECAITLGCVLEASSPTAYDSATHSFLTFCNNHQISIDPTPDTLNLYIVYMCHFVKPNSVRSYLSGICNKLEPIFPNICCTKLHAVITHHKQPLTQSSLFQLHAIYSISLEHDDLLFFAMILMGFHGLLHLGELAWPNKIEHRDYRKVIIWHTVSISSIAFEFLLPTHK
ncbi:hypothetical protein M422DRAFT_100724, partial [Sphaerobolus stellatus SS14]